jgi:hypothetical protein
MGLPEYERERLVIDFADALLQRNRRVVLIFAYQDKFHRTVAQVPPLPEIAENALQRGGGGKGKFIEARLSPSASPRK